MKIRDKHLVNDKTKNNIYNICLNNIGTVNSFVGEGGVNYFEPMVSAITRYIEEEIIGVNELHSIKVNGITLSKRGVPYRNLLRREQRRKLISSITQLEELELSISLQKEK